MLYKKELFLLIFTCLVLVKAHEHNHGHAHDHNREPAHFKYSKEANEAYRQGEGRETIHSDSDYTLDPHGHNHDTSHDQEHTHDAPPKHEHTHDAPPKHEHTHDAPPKQEHSHDTAPKHEHSHDTPPKHEHTHDAPPKHEHSHDTPPKHEHTHDIPPKHEHSHDASPKHEHSHDTPTKHEHTHDTPPKHEHSHDTPPKHEHSHDAPPKHEHTHDTPPKHEHTHETPPKHEHTHDTPHKHEHSHDTPHGHEHTHDTAHGHEHTHDTPPKHEHTHDTAHGHEHTHDASHSHSHFDGIPHGHSHQSPHTSSEARKKKTVNDYSMWLYAITSTGLISAAPVIILWFIPLDNTNKHESLLKILLSFASGGLLGDAFLHLIPHAMDPHSADGTHAHSHESGHSHDHTKHMVVGLWVVAGIIIFLCVEKSVRFLKGGHSHSHSVGDHSHTKEVNKDNKANKEDKKDGNGKKKGSSTPKKTEDIKVSGYLNLAADFAHNFTDGLAIGASFLVGNNVGMVTTVTILFHEIPHEIGDFAILIQSGCSKRRAMLLQLTTAIGAMMGTLCSLMAQGAGQAATSWILPFTAGGFIYIATVSVIPELLSDSKPGQSIKEIIAMLFGIGMMIFIALYE